MIQNTHTHTHTHIVNQATLFLIKIVFITINLMLHKKKLPLGINLTTLFNILVLQ